MPFKIWMTMKLTVLESLSLKSNYLDIHLDNSSNFQIQDLEPICFWNPLLIKGSAFSDPRVISRLLYRGDPHRVDCEPNTRQIPHLATEGLRKLSTIMVCWTMLLGLSYKVDLYSISTDCVWHATVLVDSFQLDLMRKSSTCKGIRNNLI